jgi:hypothetical protein
MTLDAQLDRATRCLLAIATDEQVQVVPVPCWSDGEALWTALPGSDPILGPLRAGGFAVSAGRLIARGTVRVFGPHDPLGLLVHGPVISMAMAALVLRHPAELRRAVQLQPVRITLDGTWAPLPPPVPPGIAPALPALVPAEIRRRLSGTREVLVAAPVEEGVELVPAVVGAGFALDGLHPLPPGTPAALVVADHAVGVALAGELDGGGALHADHATWWSGDRTDAAPLPAAPRGGVELPD